MLEKTRWITVGAAWVDRRGDGFRISLSLGIFGEVAITMKPATKRQASSPDYTLVMKVENAVVNRLLGGFSPETRPEVQPDPRSPDDIPPPEGTIPF